MLTLVDAVATNEDPVFGGLCIIQAKRYCKEHLDLDVLISLPKPPPRNRRRSPGS
jgi:hypothetical protein